MPKARPEPGAARLYALVVGAAVCLLGVVGFFYDASFDTGSSLASDYLAGTLLVNGWRNVIYLVTGLLAVALAGRAARPVAFALGGFYLVLGIWGLIETQRGIGDILDALPLGDRDNVFHLVLGALGIGAGLMDTPRPAVKLPKRRRKPKPRKPQKPRKPPEDDRKAKDGKRPAGEQKRDGKPERKPKAAESAARSERGARPRSRAGLPRDDDA